MSVEFSEITKIINNFDIYTDSVITDCKTISSFLEGAGETLGYVVGNHFGGRLFGSIVSGAGKELGTFLGNKNKQKKYEEVKIRLLKEVQEQKNVNYKILSEFIKQIEIENSDIDKMLPVFAESINHLKIIMTQSNVNVLHRIIVAKFQYLYAEKRAKEILDYYDTFESYFSSLEKVEELPGLFSKMKSKEKIEYYREAFEYIHNEIYKMIDEDKKNSFELLCYHVTAEVPIYNTLFYNFILLDASDKFTALVKRRKMVDLYKGICLKKGYLALFDVISDYFYSHIPAKLAKIRLWLLLLLPTIATAVYSIPFIKGKEYMDYYDIPLFWSVCFLPAFIIYLFIHSYKYRHAGAYIFKKRKICLIKGDVKEKLIQKSEEIANEEYNTKISYTDILEQQTNEVSNNKSEISLDTQNINNEDLLKLAELADSDNKK